MHGALQQFTSSAVMLQRLLQRLMLNEQVVIRRACSTCAPRKNFWQATAWYHWNWACAVDGTWTLCLFINWATCL